MTQKEFIVFLKKEKIIYSIDGDNIIITDEKKSVILKDSIRRDITLELESFPTDVNIKFNNNGSVDLPSLNNITNNIEFNNSGGIQMPFVRELPEGYVFNNEGGIFMNRLESIPTGVKFNRNKGDLYIQRVNTIAPDVNINTFTGTIWAKGYAIPKGYVFNHNGSLVLGGPNIDSSIVFNNSGMVRLDSITSINKGLVFNNGGDVWLDDVIKISNTKFNNGGNVKFPSLSSFPDSNSEFNNGGDIIIPKLDDIIKIKGILNKKLYVVMAKRLGHSMFKKLS